MDELRIALLALGIVVVVGVYLTTRRKSAAPLRNTEAGGRVEPVFDTVESVGAQLPSDSEPPTMPSLSATSEQPFERTSGEQASLDIPELEDDSDPVAQAATSDVPQKVISMRIVKKGGGQFSSEPVILKLRSCGMQHGKFGIFHFLASDDDEDGMFSAASLTEPGSFDLQNVKDSELAGLSIFMLRPGPGRGVDAFDKMVETARAVATALEGELLDGDGSTLSIQRERFLREELIQYELQHLKLT